MKKRRRTPNAGWSKRERAVYSEPTALNSASTIALPDGRPRLLVCSGHFHPHVGGVERYTRELWGRLARRGWNVSIVTSRTGPDPLHEVIDGMTVLRLPAIRVLDGRLPLLRPSSWRNSVRSALIDWRPDAVVTNTRFFPTTLFGLGVASAAHAPSLHIDHGSEHIHLPIPLGMTISKAIDHTLGSRALRRATAVVGVSEAVTRFLAHLGREGAGVLPNGVEIARFEQADGSAFRTARNIPAEAVLVSYVGRLIEDKGILTLLDAWPRLEADEAHLVVAGDGPLARTIRERTAQLKNVHLLGAVDSEDIPPLFAASDIFVHPSAYPEGLPTSILEGAAATVALIATAMGGTAEIVRSPAHGLIVPPRDPEALATAVRTLIADPELRRSMGEAARSVVRERFDWEAVANEAERILGTLGVSVGDNEARA
jgi:glycosyltransferase involved in cell wall biosynthesis